MVVADASAVVEMLLATPRGGAIAEHLTESGQPTVAPQLLDIEVLQVIRRFNRTNRLTAARAEQALEDLGKLAITRYEHEPLRPAIWRLRNVLTAYDATYVALAELLGGSIVTCDAKLTRSTGHDVTFRLF